MKKLLLFVSFFFVINVRCDELSDAIRATDVEKVRAVLDANGYVPKGRDKYLAIAKELLDLRKNQLVEGSAITKSLPQTSQVFWMSTILGSAYYAFWFKNGVGYSSKYEYGFFRALGKAIGVWVCIGAVTGFSHWYKNKIKTLEDNYNNAIIIYELIYERENNG